MHRIPVLAATIPLIALALGGCQSATKSASDSSKRSMSEAPPSAATHRATRTPEPSNTLASQVAEPVQPRVRFTRGANTAPLDVKVELARTPEERRKGLMHREFLAKGEGMLFIFSEEKIQRFWMKNTLIPLDMIHLDRQGRVVGVVAEAQPHDLRPVGVQRPAMYVLEVPGGWSASVGITVGSQATFHGIDTAPNIRP